MIAVVCDVCGCVIDDPHPEQHGPHFCNEQCRGEWWRDQEDDE